MHHKTFNVIGCGRVATTISQAFLSQGFILKGLVNQSKASGARASEHLKAGTVLANLADLPAADIWLVGVPDEQLTDIATILKKHPNIQPGNVIVHLSGANPAALFQKSTASAVSLHCMFSFPSVLAPEALSGSLCALEGDTIWVPVLKAVMEKIGCYCIEIQAEQKMLYHAIGVFMANYQFALGKAADLCGKYIGLTEEQVRQACLPLAQGALNNWARFGQQALTGPVARGDQVHITQQADALSKEDKELGALYQNLATFLQQEH